jgi:UDP-N-acetylmuramoyl-tripeptide--D-alanyl-D-alanine ligase
MMYVLSIIASIWVMRIVANVLSFIRLWYTKEYRMDRMMIHLGTKQGKKLYILPLRLPPLSPKSLSIFIGSLCILGGLFVVLKINIFLVLLILDILSFPITGLLVFFTSIPTRIYHQYLIAKAVGLLRAHKELVVIGITGSYGKTSTKEFVASILSNRYKVLKTEASKNSPIGIAEVILKNLISDTQIFIVEMGAYKKGEIAKMSDMVRPQIGVVTAINAQHQDLFGTIENTKKAKYELIQGLKGKKVAIFNADNPGTQDMASWAKRDKREVWTYTKEQKATFRAGDIMQTEKGLSFTLFWNGKKQNIQTSIIGEQFVGNIVAAVAAAVAAGMSFEDACMYTRTLHPVDKTMHLIINRNGLRLIDDTFNNNPDAAIAAINYLSKTSAKKILVFQPMIELGAYASESHKDVGERAARVCDEILLTNGEYYDDFLTGVARFDANKKVYVMNPTQSANFIREHTDKGDTVLFKGKESERVLALLRS